MGCTVGPDQLGLKSLAKEFGLSSLRSREPWQDFEEESDVSGPVPEKIHRGEGVKHELEQGEVEG